MKNRWIEEQEHLGMSLVTINLARQLWRAAPSQAIPKPGLFLQRKAESSKSIKAEPQFSTVTITPHHVFNAVLVGSAGSGKSFAAGLWIWRYVQCGGHAIVLSGEEQRDSLHRLRHAAAGLLDSAGLPHATPLSSAYLTWDAPGTLDGQPSLTIVDTTLEHNTVLWDGEQHRQQRGQIVSNLIHQITANRTAHARFPVPPLVVVIDDEIDLEVIAHTVADVLATWPALGIHLWITVQSLDSVVNSSTIPVRSLWQSAKLRIFFHANYYPETLKFAIGLSPEITQYICYLVPGEVVIQQNSDCVVASITPTPYELRSLAR